MHSAAPVGRIVLRLFDIRDPAAVALSDDVCIGLQLANFAQDVSVDTRLDAPTCCRARSASTA